MVTQTLCKFESINKISAFGGESNLIKIIKAKPDDYEKMIIKIVDDSKKYYLMYLGKIRENFYFIMLDTLYFDNKNFKLSSPEKTTESKIVSLLEVDRIKVMSRNNPFSFKNTKLIGDSDVTEIQIKNMYFLVQNENDELFLDSNYTKLENKFKIKKKIKDNLGTKSENILK